MRLATETRVELVSLYESGLRVSEIGRRFGIRPSTVVYVARAAGVPMRGKGGGPNIRGRGALTDEQVKGFQRLRQLLAVDESAAFWPGNREDVPIRVCQRCGDAVTSPGWWCAECDKVIWYLQQTRLWSMARIHASGEYNEGLRATREESWLSDIAPGGRP